MEELLIRRKEQEARIELQRQEKEKAREDAARERARFVLHLMTCQMQKKEKQKPFTALDKKNPETTDNSF